jgi:hypothetical protein
VNYPNHVHSIGVSDPHVLADKLTNKYYMTASGFTFSGEPAQRKPGIITALVSEDLIHWSNPQIIFDCNGTDFWGSIGYPATEMHCINGKYYLSTTGRPPEYPGKSMILMADNPLGSFKWLSNKPYSPPGWQTLDTTLYVDKKGHPWIVYAHEWVQVSDGQFAAQPLSDDLSRSIGNPMILFRASEAVWSDDQIWSKTDGGGVTDGCWLHRMDDDSLIMLWTSRSRTGYAMGYARSNSGEIYGPWIQMERPLYGHDGGHCMLFRKLDDGQLIMSMHLADRGPKILSFFEMEEKDGALHIINEITGNWLISVGGTALPYKKNISSCEEPAFTKLGIPGWAAAKESIGPAIKSGNTAKKIISEPGKLPSSGNKKEKERK